MRTPLISAALIALTACGGGDTDASSASLYDRWQVTSIMASGAEMPETVTATMSTTLTETTYHAIVAGQSDKGTIVVDGAASPPRIDITGTDGPNAGTFTKAVYQLDGDTLTISYDVTGQAYPADFDSQPGRTDMVVTYKRAE